MSKNEKSKTDTQKEAVASNLPKLEVMKHPSLGMLVGTSGALTYFGVTDKTGQTKWRLSVNPKKVFDRFEAVCGVEGAGEKEKKEFQTFFQSATAPVKDLRFQVVVVEVEQPKAEALPETPAAG